MLVHEWSDVARLYDVGDRELPLTLDEFRALRSPLGLTPLTLADLGAWLVAHPDVDIVTDFKNNPAPGLEALHQGLPDLRHRFVAQIYNHSDTATVARLGFERRILTLYRSFMSDAMVRRWIAKHPVYAVATPLRRTEPEFLAILKEADLFIYTHTVNDPEQAAELRAKGIDGFYTDVLLPNATPLP